MADQPGFQQMNDSPQRIVEDRALERISQDITLGWTLAICGLVLALISYFILSSVGGTVFGTGLGVFAVVLLIQSLSRRKALLSRYSSDR